MTASSMARPHGPEPERDARAWGRLLAPFREPDPGRSLFELLLTLGSFLGLWLLAWASLDVGYWATLILAVPTAGFLVRLFMIQHDCGHGSFFRRRLTNDWVGRALGVLTMTPYDDWRRAHAVHHATSANLDRRGMGDITTLTVREYQALPWRRRAAYRLYRHPVVMFGHGPAYLRPALGIAVQTGEMPVFAATGRRLDLGSRVVFEPEVAVGYRIAPRVSIEAALVHRSHAGLFNSRQNPGMDSLGLRLNFSL